MAGCEKAVQGNLADRAPTKHDLHLESIAENGRTDWRKRSGDNRRAFVEASVSRLKQVTRD